MKNKLMVVAILTANTLLAGCSSDHIMHMKDGRTVIVQGDPQQDKATGMMIYTDENGQQQAVNQADIKDMSNLNN